MITTATIVGYDGENLILRPNGDIDREIIRQKSKLAEIRLDDGRTISTEQRKKIFAIIRDISLWSGHEPEYLRMYLTWDFMSEYGCEWFSLSDVDMSTAREFLNYLIGFCFTHNVPTKKPLREHSDDIGRYLYACLEHRKCAVCNDRAEVHHVDRIGMGRDREKIVHVGLKAVALCPIHHEEAHASERDFFDKYKIFGIKLDEYLVRILRL